MMPLPDWFREPYRPDPVRRRTVAKASGGVRQLTIPSERDRELQTAVLRWIAPRVDAGLHPNVHGFRQGRSCDTAIRDLLRQAGRRPHLEFLQADLRELFDRIPLDRLRAVADRASAEPRWRSLVGRWLAAWPTSPGRGIPQGAPLSPLLANLYLGATLDPAMRGAPVCAWIRYADDLTLVSDTRGGAILALSWLAGVVRRAGLEVAPRKTVVATAGAVASVAIVLGRRVSITRAAGGWELLAQGAPRGERAG